MACLRVDLFIFLNWTCTSLPNNALDKGCVSTHSSSVSLSPLADVCFGGEACIAGGGGIVTSHLHLSISIRESDTPPGSQNKLYHSYCAYAPSYSEIIFSLLAGQLLRLTFLVQVLKWL